MLSVANQSNATLNGNASITAGSNLLVANGGNLLVAQSAALGGSLEVDGSLTIDTATQSTQNIDALAGSGTLSFEDTANPAQPQAASLSIGASGLSSSFAGTIGNQSNTSLALVKAGGGTFTLAAANSYSGGTTIDAGTLDLSAANAAGTAAITFAGSNTSEATLKLEAAAQPASGSTFGNALASFGNEDALDLAGFANGVVQYDPILAPNTLTVTNGARTESFTLAKPGALAFVARSDGNGGTLIDDGVMAVCFAQGTRIRTTFGDKAIETLASGDLVLTSTGREQPIRWLGHRRMDCRRHPRRHEVMPIRIAAHALGENRPARDLVVSPGHAICIDVLGEVLIPAGELVNGTTVSRESVDHVTYWHLELEGGHDIILAENMPCESYLDMGNRAFFAQADIVDLAASPDAVVPTHADFCRPFHRDGAIVGFVRERLASRALALGWTLEHDPYAGMRLIVDGRTLQPEQRGLSARFTVPAAAQDVWLMSNTSVPAEVGVSLDRRELGVCVGALVVDDGFGSPQTIKADDPRLGAGFHDIEEGPQRWTAGRARLGCDLWRARRGVFFVRVDMTRPALPRWAVPAATGMKGSNLKVG